MQAPPQSGHPIAAHPPSLCRRGRSVRSLPVVLGAVLALLMALLPGVTSTAAPNENSDAGTRGSAYVDAELRAQVASADGEPVTALIMLQDTAGVNALSGDREEVVSQLQQTAAQSQEALESRLSQSATALADVQVINRFWISNAMLVEMTGGAQELNTLAEVPGIHRIIPNFEVTAPSPETSERTTADDGPHTWGLDRIRAPQVWDELGLRGDGVRVATLDTGVDISHPDLTGKMATDDPSDPTYPGGWMEFDEFGNLVSSEPHETQYHGTHVAGTIQGGDASGQAIGVAPEAEMMHGLVIPDGGGSWAQVLAGMEWAIAPTDAHGNPAGQPADIVNMSLGARGFRHDMIEPTINMRSAGVLPVYAVGNSCPTNGTHSPGNVFESVAAGNTTEEDLVNPGSCGGVVEKDQFPVPPAHWPDRYVKPDLSAPGTQVWSASPGGHYRHLSGTSMAAPHIAGTAALMLEADPELGVDEVQEILEMTAVWKDQYAHEAPDIRYGHGRIDAFEAALVAAVRSGVEGTVIDAETDKPIEGATVSAVGVERDAVTREDGSFRLLLEAGTYDIDVEAFGYEDHTLTDLTVQEESFTAADVRMAASPTGTIAGTVTYSPTGQGLAGADIALADVGADVSTRAGADGSYVLAEVPAGTYQVTVSRPEFRSPEPAEVTVTASGTAVLNLELDPPQHRVATIGGSSVDYRDFLRERGYQVDNYHWGQLASVTDYHTIVAGRGAFPHPTQEDWDHFTAETDASNAGVVFIDSPQGSRHGIHKLHEFTGHPTEIGATGEDEPVSSTLFYEVTQEHPILEGYAAGDRIPVNTGEEPKPLAWFGDYAGEGREVLAAAGRDDDTEIYGNGIAVQQRASNRYALLSLNGVSFDQPIEDWTSEAAELFTNAVDWVSPTSDPERPTFVVFDLAVDTEVVQPDAEVEVTARVKNIGARTGEYHAILSIDDTEEASEQVELDAGEVIDLSWTVSREDLGSYTLQVGTQTAEFRVRAPYVDLEVHQVRTPENPQPGPLTGATVELITPDGELVGMGQTNEEGTLRLETTAAIGEYTVVVRHGGATDGNAYVLTEQLTIIDDADVAIRPRVLAGGQAVESATDTFVTMVDFSLEQVDERHSAVTYLRPEQAAPHGFRVDPGTVVASLGDYELVQVHQVQRTERDWWLPTEIAQVQWDDPFPQVVPFGGEAELSIAEVTYAEGQVGVDWQLVDAHGTPFATALATDLRPLADLPEVLVLEEVLGEVRGSAPNEGELVMRLLHGEEELRAGRIDWNARPATISQPDLPAGEYTVALEAQTGFYAGELSDAATVIVGDAATGPEVTRVEGIDRYQTAAKVSADLEPGIDTVYLATGDTFPDALAAAARAGSRDAPVLLTRPDRLPATTAAELERLEPAEVVILGGETAVSAQVEHKVANYADAVDRVFGDNRYETAARLSADLAPGVQVAYLATGDTFPDALAGAARAGSLDGPVLLTQSSSLPQATLMELQRLQPQEVVILGGETAISADVAAVASEYAEVRRMSGDDRYQTAAELSAQVEPGVHVAYLATGEEFPDALAGAARAGALDGPVLLTQSSSLPQATLGELQRLQAEHIVVLGGGTAVSEAVLQEVADLDYGD